MSIKPSRRGTLGWAFVIGLALTLTGGIGLSLAQVPRPQERLEAQAPLGIAFTYQGQLKSSGQPVDATCDMAFRLYDEASGGSRVGTPITMPVTISDGLFTANLDFGSGVFYGEARWLDIRVKCASLGDAGYTAMGRQTLTPAPYALSLPGLYTQPERGIPNVIGGWPDNLAWDPVMGGVIGGGGGPGIENVITDRFCTVSGGANNLAGDESADGTDAWFATVSGGWENRAVEDNATVVGGAGNTASGVSSFVGGGWLNTATGMEATVGGGRSNTANGWSVTIGGGISNTITGTVAFIGGGQQNVAEDWASTIGGGWLNRVGASYATVGGGGQNSASATEATVGGGAYNHAGGESATVPGGFNNGATGDFSFAAGRNAYALHDGAFVWADSQSVDFDSTTANQFSARATGGVRFVSAVDGSGNPTAGVHLAAGAGSWSSLSDRQLKENVQLADVQEVLARLLKMRISTWNYKSQDPSVRHIGPMAQDFFAAFGLGEDDRYISNIDAEGVALAAIQALYQQNEDLAAENNLLRKQLDDLEARVTGLEERLSGTSPAQSGPAILPSGAGLVTALAAGGLLAVGLWASQGRLVSRLRRGNR